MNIEAIWNEAVEAGRLAAKKCVPKPMTVIVGGEKFVELDGPCGFAWLVIRPARGPLVKYLKSQQIGDNHVYGGWNVWMRDYDQSMYRKEAHARAMADVLKSHGFDVLADSRMD